MANYCRAGIKSLRGTTPAKPQRGKNPFIFLNVPCKMPQDNILSRAIVLPSENFNAIFKSCRYELFRDANNTLLN
jgi:hypothetical protein